MNSRITGSQVASVWQVRVGVKTRGREDKRACPAVERVVVLQWWIATR